MENSNGSHEKLKVSGTAADWFSRLRRDDLSPDVYLAFEAWLAEDSGHKIEYEFCEAIWDESKSAVEGSIFAATDKGWASSVPESLAAPVEYGRKRLFGLAPQALGLAAAAVLMLGIWSSGLLDGGRYSTMIGEQRSIILEDESSIHLNTATSLQVDYSKERRLVELKEGEALFSVAHDPERPFVVIAGSGMIQAIGTRFDVYRQGNRVTVTVLDGVVRVVHSAMADQTEAESGSTNLTKPRSELHGGETLRYDADSWKEASTGANLRRVEAWRRGKLVLDDYTLAEAMAEVNRYTESKIVLGDESLESLSISGVFHVGDTKNILAALNSSFGIEANRENGEIILMPGKR